MWHGSKKVEKTLPYTRPLMTSRTFLSCYFCDFAHLHSTQRFMFVIGKVPVFISNGATESSVNYIISSGVWADHKMG